MSTHPTAWQQRMFRKATEVLCLRMRELEMQSMFEHWDKSVLGDQVWTLWVSFKSNRMTLSHIGRNGELVYYDVKDDRTIRKLEDNIGALVKADNLLEGYSRD